MVNLESDTPYFYWTFDRLGDLEQGQIECGFDGSVWKSDLILAYEIGEAHLTFDSPAKWAEGFPHARLIRNPNGHYEYRSEGVTYDAVRAATQSHVVLTGRWSQNEFGKGTFIAVLPIKQIAEILLENAVAVPVASEAPELVARDRRCDRQADLVYAIGNFMPRPRGPEANALTLK